MPPKTLDQEVKGLNDGLISMDAIEAPTDNLPVKVDESHEDEMNVDTDVWVQLAYRSDQANKHPRYIPSFKKNITSILEDHDFIEEDGYYTRIRGEEVDYLFLEKFVDEKNKGTFWVTLDYKDNKDFEKLLNNYINLNDMTVNYWNQNSRPLGPLFLGMATGFAVGLGVGYGIPDYSSIVVVLTSVASGLSSLGGTIFGAQRIDRYYLSKKAEATYKNLIENYGEMIESKNDIYDLDVVKHFLKLTPKELIGNKSGGGHEV